METEQERRKRIENLLPPEITQQLKEEWNEILRSQIEREDKIIAAHRHELVGLDATCPELLEAERDFQRKVKAFLKKRDDLMEEQARILDLKEKD